MAARYADYTNFGQSVEEFVHKSDVLAGHCREVGTAFERIVRSKNFNVVCAETEGEVEDRIGWIRDHYSKFVAEERLDRMESLYREMAGTPEQLIEKLHAWSAVGMDYAIVYFAESAYDTSGLELFAKQVVPALS